MEYSQVRDSIKSGDVLAFSHSGWKTWSDIESQIVRMATRSEFSHVAMVFWFGDRLFAIEAVVPEIRIYPVSNFEEFYLLEIDHPIEIKDIEFALSKVGQKYSKWEAIKGYISSTKENELWQCAELVKSILTERGMYIDCKTTPTDLVRCLMEKYGCSLELITNRR